MLQFTQSLLSVSLRAYTNLIDFNGDIYAALAAKVSINGKTFTRKGTSDPFDAFSSCIEAVTVGDNILILLKILTSVQTGDWSSKEYNRAPKLIGIASVTVAILSVIAIIVIK